MADTPSRLKVTDFKDIQIVEFVDNKILDEANIKEIGDSLIGLIDKTPNARLLIDFAAVDHLSSAALGMLINVNNKIKQQNGQLRLTNIKPQIMEVFTITNLNKLFKILPHRPEALASFTS